MKFRGRDRWDGYSSQKSLSVLELRSYSDSGFTLLLTVALFMPSLPRLNDLLESAGHDVVGILLT